MKTPSIYCRFGEGEATCSFLMTGPIGIECAKGTSFEFLILQRRASKSMRAMGDNCSGSPTYTPNV